MSFLRHQLALDQFSRRFTEDADRQIYFKPTNHRVPMPLSDEDYSFWTARFETQHRIGMAAFWLFTIAGMGYGYYQWFQTDRWLPLIIPVAAGFVFGWLILLNRSALVLVELNTVYEAWRADRKS